MTEQLRETSREPLIVRRRLGTIRDFLNAMQQLANDCAQPEFRARAMRGDSTRTVDSQPQKATETVE